MKKEDIFNLQKHELDTDHEVSVFLDDVFQELVLEALDEVNILLDKYPFMGQNG